MSICATTSAGATPPPPELYGKYLGVSYQDAARGKSFDESLFELTIDSQGVHRTETIGGQRFEVTYPPEWLGPAKKPGLLSLRQGRQSARTETTLRFYPELSLTGIAARIFTLVMGAPLQSIVVESRGHLHGTSADTVAILTRRDAQGRDKKSLRQFYFYAQDNVEPDNLRPEDSVFSGPVTPDEIRARVAQLDYAINQSGNPALRRNALQQALQNSRVPQMIPVVIRAIEGSIEKDASGAQPTPAIRDGATLSAAVDIAEAQLFDAFNILSVVAGAETRYGTADLAQIQSRTGGKISAEERDFLRSLALVQAWPTRMYSKQDLTALTGILNQVVARVRASSSPANLDFSTDHLQKLQRTLLRYSNPSACQARLSS